MAIQSGSRFGRFEVRSLLGTGGLGEIYEAIDTATKRSVVLKVLRSELSGKLSKYFARELHRAASLSHPNICKVYTLDQTPGMLVVAMENIPGRNLHQLINGRPLDLRDALQIEIQVANALVEGHRHNLVHRDLKPGKVMVMHTGQVKVLDFGMPRFLEGKEGWLNVVKGPKEPYLTPIYAAPEQALAGMADPRSNIFSAGAVLYEMLAGEPPFQAATSKDALLATTTQTPPPISSLRGESIPNKLNDVLHRALAKDPNNRYQQVRDFRDDLARILEETSRSRILDRHPLANRYPTKGRVVNASLVNGEVPLKVGMTYWLEVNIGSPRGKTVGEHPFSEPDWRGKTELEILIALNSLDADITPERTTAMLPKDTDMKPVLFQIKPTNSDSIQVRLSIYLAHDLILLEKFHFQLATVRPVLAAAK